MAEVKNKEVVNMEHIDSLKERLATVSNEIDAIKSSFSKNTEDLSRIQTMLGVENIGHIGNIVDKYETKIAEAESQRAEAVEGARKYSEELDKEKERLIKLWDAYKNQEEELSTVEKRVNEFAERTKVAEASKQQLEEDLTARINTLNKKVEEYQNKANKFDEYKNKCEQFDNIRNQLEREIHDLKETNKQKENMINEMNEKIKELSGKEDFSQFKEKYEEMTVEYEKEKERLTKLYQLYEETDFELKKIKKENQDWQNWYNSNKDMFNKLFASIPTSNPAQNVQEKKVSNPPNQTEDVDVKNKKKKKKLRLRKK